MIDLHSHILPGIDDGARTLEDSVNIVRELSEQGITDVVATPHYVAETMYVSPLTRNAELLEQLRERLADEGLEVKVFLGNEIYIDSKISDLLKAGEIATMAGSDYLLVELPLNDEYPNYIDILGDLMQSGHKVILAHPERYAFGQSDFETLRELYDMGLLFQCNLGSFIGKYDKEAEKTAIRLAKEKMIFALGSDIHHYHHGKDNGLAVAQKKLKKYYRGDKLEQVLVRNPRKVIDGQV